MLPPRGRVAAIAALAAAVALVSTSVYLGRGTLLESWHLRRLSHEDERVRSDAARALERLGSVRAAVRFLRSALEERGPSGLEVRAALALKTRGPSGASVLAHELRREPWTFRIRIAESLRAFKVPPEYVASILGQALADESPAIRRWGAEWLARWPETGGTQAPRLRELLSDPDEDVRLWAGISLGRLEAAPEGVR